jgi:hypothetical protein
MLLAMLLTGCGGGGGGGTGGDGSPATVQARAETAAGTGASSSAVAAGPIEPLMRTEAQGQDVSPFRTRTAEPELAPSSVLLPPLADQEKTTLSTSRTSSVNPENGTPTRTGIARSVAVTASEASTTVLLNWRPSIRGGRIAALTFRSPDAMGLRLGVLVRSLPMASVLRFYTPGSGTAFEVPGQEVLALIQRNLDAGDATDAARTYWSPDLGGDSVTMEIEVPKGIDPAATQVSVPRLSHIYRRLSERKGDERERDVGDAGTCQRDVTCDPAYERESRSVALMYFVEDGATYSCTGTLLNDRASSGTPFFLSANHCISNQTVASTLVTAWFFRASACANATPLPEAKVLMGGATLLYASTDTDTSFMRLNAAPPVGAIHAGSSAFAPELGMTVFGLHHPVGDLQKLNLGTFQGFAFCTSSTDGSYTCSSSAPSFAKYLRVGWQQGATEGGSSGSGLFTRMNGNSYLVGQLRGGASSCTNRSGTDTYGRFDLAYRASLSQWLNQASATTRMPVFRFYNVKTATHFYTTDVVERDRTISKYGSVFIYEGPVFYAYGAQAPGSSSVYRFYNTRTDSHFYTISEAERANVTVRYPWFSFEGTSWYANLSQGAGSTPVYRFYNTLTGTHFYTISASERDTVQQRYPQFLYEGGVYEAWTAP